MTKTAERLISLSELSVSPVVLKDRDGRRHAYVRVVLDGEGVLMRAHDAKDFADLLNNRADDAKYHGE